MNDDQAQALRAEFPSEQVGQIPRGGAQLDYVGHAAVTDRLLSVDAGWTWEPFARDEHGAPLITDDGKRRTLWINLTVCDVTRPGVGIVVGAKDEVEKELISDAIRNAAMRFGVALDLWHKGGSLNGDGPDVEPAGPDWAGMGWHDKADHDRTKAKVKALAGDLDAAAKRRLKAWNDDADVVKATMSKDAMAEWERQVALARTSEADAPPDDMPDDQEPDGTEPF